LPAVARNRFVPPFSLQRMTWIKPFSKTYLTAARRPRPAGRGRPGRLARRRAHARRGGPSAPCHHTRGCRFPGPSFPPGKRPRRRGWTGGCFATREVQRSPPRPMLHDTTLLGVGHHRRGVRPQQPLPFRDGEFSLIPLRTYSRSIAPVHTPIIGKKELHLGESTMREQATSQSPEEEISAREAHARLSAPGSEALLIDVREPWEFQPRRAQGAVNIPLSQFMQRFAEIPRERDALIICEHGVRSLQVVKFLARQGYRHTLSVDGGTEMWEVAGLPMDYGDAGSQP
jgi:rhodanese-related sulfurtransferase